MDRSFLRDIGDVVGARECVAGRGGGRAIGSVSGLYFMLFVVFIIVLHIPLIVPMYTCNIVVNKIL